MYNWFVMIEDECGTEVCISNYFNNRRAAEDWLTIQEIPEEWRRVWIENIEIPF